MLQTGLGPLNALNAVMAITRPAQQIKLPCPLQGRDGEFEAAVAIETVEAMEDQRNAFTAAVSLPV